MADPNDRPSKPHVVSNALQILEKSVSPEIAQIYAELIPPIVKMARSCIRDLDPQVRTHHMTTKTKPTCFLLACCRSWQQATLS